MGRRLIILVALFIVSSCNVNCYKEVTRKETKKEIKQRRKLNKSRVNGIYSFRDIRQMRHHCGGIHWVGVFFFVRGEGAFELTDKTKENERN